MMQCRRCYTWMNDEEAYTLTHAGTMSFTGPYCDPSADLALAER